jgi:hypothetical protein
MIGRKRAAQVLDFEPVPESTENPISRLLVQLAERVHESFSGLFLPTLHLDSQNPKLQEAVV